MEQEKVVIITGAAGGIGGAAAERFARGGFRIVLADIQEEALHKQAARLSENYGAACLVCPGDLTEMDYVKSIVDQAVRHWGRVDVLLNNAAWRTIETMRTISADTWEKTIRICLTAPAFLAKWAAAAMEEQHIPGAIINISSIMSQRAGGSSPAYIACKGAIESLTYELAVLYGPKGIRVAGVNPGNIETNLSNDYTDENGNNISGRLKDDMNEHTPLQRAGTPADIANACYWLSTGEASFITGATIVVDGGFSHNFNAYPMKKLKFPGEF